MTLLRSAVVAILFTLTWICIQQSAPACQRPEDFLSRVVPEQCTFLIQWNGMGDLDAQRSPTEKWLAQDEIQLTLKKLFRAIEEYQSLYPMENPILNELMSKAPMIAKDCPATMYMGTIDPNAGFEKTVSVGFFVKLNEHEDWVNGIVRKILESDEGQQFEPIQFEGKTVYQMSPGGREQQAKVHFAVIDGHLMMTFGEFAFENAMRDMKSPEPNWLGDLRQSMETADGRTIGLMHFDPTRLFEMNARMDERDRIPAFLALDQLKSVSVSMGLDRDGFFTSTFLKCPGKLQGVWASLGIEPIDRQDINELPDDAMSTGAIRCNPAKIFELVESGFSLSGDSDSLPEFVDIVESISGLEFEAELLDSFTGLISSYQSLNPLAGGTGTSGVITLGIKEPKVFADRLAKFNRSLRAEVEAMGMGQLVEKQSQGRTVYSLEQPAFLGPGFQWCQIENRLYVAMDNSSIRTHLRKRERESGRLIDDPWFKQMYEYGQSKEWGNPIAFSHVDVVTVIELLVPVAQTFLAGQEIPDFDFTIDDLPPVDVLTNGVNANVTMVFKAPDGFRIIERSTLPGTSSVAISGVMVGMLLPAVQQVRQAARRTTTMNNIRQLQLALLNYESTHGHLPPAYSTDPDGKPLLSWRVHILPYLEEQELYDRFRLDEPWDSEHNQKLISEMPVYFENPGIASPVKGETTFLGVAGANGVFVVPQGLKFAQIQDGSSQTISIVDANRAHMVVWTSPRDFDFAKQDDIMSALTGTWSAGPMVGMCDGSAHIIGKKDFSQDELRSLLDRRDGADIDIMR